MRIGYDAKRAFFNRRGLGNYSRDTIRIMTNIHADNDYCLYTPNSEVKISFDYNRDNTQVVAPTGIQSYRPFSSMWRTEGICKNISNDKIDLYHGLSHELPYGIEKLSVRSVVTMHDLIFLKNPDLFPFFDRYSFKKKYTHGAHIADRIIAISEETKADLINCLGEKEERIDVVYQGCNPVFHHEVNEEELCRTKKKYALPSQFMLIVCAIEKRKNHELILKAMTDPRIDLPLVIVGRPSEYKKELQEIIQKYHIENRVIFVQEVATQELPALYKLATLFVYPSHYEGFGIPVLEALTMGVPVITSKGSCMMETGGDAALYVNPKDSDELADTIYNVLTNETLRESMVTKGLRHAEKFSDESIAKNLYAVYRKVLG